MSSWMKCLHRHGLSLQGADGYGWLQGRQPRHTISGGGVQVPQAGGPDLAASGPHHRVAGRLGRSGRPVPRKASGTLLFQERVMGGTVATLRPRRRVVSQSRASRNMRLSVHAIRSVSASATCTRSPVNFRISLMARMMKRVAARVPAYIFGPHSDGFRTRLPVEPAV